PATLCELVRNLDQTDKGVGIAAVEPWGPEGSITVLDEVTHFRGSRLFLMKEGQSRPVLLASLLFGMPSITCGACIIRASVFHAVGGFDCVLPYYEDLDLYIKAIRHGGHVFLNKVLLYRRTGMPSLINDSYENPKHSTRCYRAINTSFRKQYGILEFFILRLIAAIFRKSRPRWPSFTHAFRREFAESDFVPKISSEIRGQLRHPTTV
ncbi:MAG: hypothetical protein NTX25_01470, partial [Proteobacteria bacterium]|nr:hypothetical protein [Pseudomonadota bacterium]